MLVSALPGWGLKATIITPNGPGACPGAAPCPPGVRPLQEPRDPGICGSVQPMGQGMPSPVFVGRGDEVAGVVLPVAASRSGRGTRSLESASK
jgi:hypothetical protein